MERGGACRSVAGSSCSPSSKSSNLSPSMSTTQSHQAPEDSSLWQCTAPPGGQDKQRTVKMCRVVFYISERFRLCFICIRPYNTLH